MKEKIIEMLHIQGALDNSFMEYMGNDKLDINKVKMALFDELGEVNHEMKAEWCYWKKSQEPVNRDKLKEELADVWHFALTLHRLKNGFTFNDRVLYGIKWVDEYTSWFGIVEIINRTDYINDVIYYVILLTEKLGFTFEEMYDAYVKYIFTGFHTIKISVNVSNHHFEKF